MSTHVIFAAPFFMDATLRFLKGSLQLPGVDLTLVSQDPLERLPDDIRQGLAGHWQIDDALDPNKLVEAATELQRHFGPASRYFGPLEQLQVPLAMARQSLGIDGLDVETAQNFRDKALMKSVLREAGVPCARHLLATDVPSALGFAETVGFPLIVKPPAGAGGKATYRIDNRDQLIQLLERAPPGPGRAVLFEEFVSGTEHSFDSVMSGGELLWHSISRYMPSPLEVLENPWIQWCVLLPREIDGAEFEPIRQAAGAGLQALGLKTGLSHMEWFRLRDDRIAISADHVTIVVCTRHRLLPCVAAAHGLRRLRSAAAAVRCGRRVHSRPGMGYGAPHSRPGRGAAPFRRSRRRGQAAAGRAVPVGFL
jgi:hypothetical protein